MHGICPTTGKPLIPDAAMLLMPETTRIVCPACGNTHLWDPKRRLFRAEPSTHQDSN